MAKNSLLCVGTLWNSMPIWRTFASEPLGSKIIVISMTPTFFVLHSKNCLCFILKIAHLLNHCLIELRSVPSTSTLKGLLDIWIRVTKESTELANKTFPRLHDSPPGPEVESRNLGQTFLANSVHYRWENLEIVNGSVWMAIIPKQGIQSLHFICVRVRCTKAYTQGLNNFRVSTVHPGAWNSSPCKCKWTGTKCFKLRIYSAARLFVPRIIFQPAYLFNFWKVPNQVRIYKGEKPG